jgi:hypothetical protein
MNRFYVFTIVMFLNSVAIYSMEKNRKEAVEKKTGVLSNIAAAIQTPKKEQSNSTKSCQHLPHIGHQCPHHSLNYGTRP